MTSSTRQSISRLAPLPVGDGLLDTEKSSGEAENTYILRPIFQQRRVADGMWQGRPRECWVRQAEVVWEPNRWKGARGAETRAYRVGKGWAVWGPEWTGRAGRGCRLLGRSCFDVPTLLRLQGTAEDWLYLCRVRSPAAQLGWRSRNG